MLYLTNAKLIGISQHCKMHKRFVIISKYTYFITDTFHTHPNFLHYLCGGAGNEI